MQTWNTVQSRRMVDLESNYQIGVRMIIIVIGSLKTSHISK